MYSQELNKEGLEEPVSDAESMPDSKPSKRVLNGFLKLSIREELVKALKEIGINEPTAIQEKTIPMILAGKDVIGVSKTGSGKTVAFGLPLLEKIVPGNGIQVLIIGPTRELAVQISQELRKFGKYLKFNVATIYGGVSINPQIEELERADIVVGTPGRLLDHLQRRTLDLSRLVCAVLDEADKMIEMGFIEDIEMILNSTPEYRQVLLFGATISDEIGRLKHQYMHQPETVRTEEMVEESLLEQYYYNIEPREKFSLLVHLLKKENVGLAIIFCSKISTVELVTRNLKHQGIKAEMLHGKLSQNRRLRALENFHQAKPNILVASAVAARGLDIKDVTHVINYDLSQDPQEYVHRIGRTARAGEAGKAITLLESRDYDTFGEILKRFQLKVTELQKEDFPRLRFEVMQRSRGPQRFGGNQFGGQRPGGQFGGGRFSGQRRDGPRPSGQFGERRFGGQRSGGRFGERRSSSSDFRSEQPRERKFGHRGDERFSHSSRDHRRGFGR